MFKIDTGGYVFSCLFDSGAEISCMNMETVVTPGLQMDTNPNFPPRRQQHAHFNEGFNRRYSPPIFPSPGFNNTMASVVLGLTSQTMPNSISVNAANGDHIGVAGDVCVNFKIGRKCSFTHNFVVCERLSHLSIIDEDFMRKHYMLLQWVPENK